MIKGIFTFGAVAVFCITGIPNIARSADREVAKYARLDRSRPIYCGVCGCLYVTYDYHRELRSTYGTGFDPRNYDQTEFYYYPGRMRAYPHYWSDCEPPGWHY